MFTKISMGQIVKNHYATLYDARSGKDAAYYGDIVTFFGIPAVSGLGAYFLSTFPYGNVLTALSILAGLSLTALIFVFELRSNLAEKYEPGDKELQVVEELFHNLMYSLFCALVTILLCVISDADYGAGVGAVLRVAVMVLCSHYLLALLMCLKRLSVAFIISIQ